MAALASWAAPVESDEDRTAAGDEAQATVEAAARPKSGFSIGFAFEPRIGSFQAVDGTLEDYGFAPVGSPVLLTYGLRARVWTPAGWMLGGAMSYGFAAREARDNPVPTTINRVETMVSAGHQLGLGFDVSFDAGFSVQSMSVGSPAQGGALVYMGPAVQPRFGWVAPIDWTYLRVIVGYSAMFPVGRPHDQPLWEAEFRQLPIHSFLLGLEMGFHMGRPEWRWGQRRGEP